MNTETSTGPSLVLLVGGRQDPNAKTALALRPQRVRFVVSRDAQHRYGILRACLETLIEPANLGEPELVDPYSVEGSRQATLCAIEALQVEGAVVSVTSATVPMSIGGYLGGLEKGVPVIYRTATDRFLALNGELPDLGGLPQTVEHYLRTYGREYVPSTDLTALCQELSITREKAYELAYRMAVPDLSELRNAFKKMYQRNGLCFRLDELYQAREAAEALLRELHDLGFLRVRFGESAAELEPASGRNKARWFLEGHWLELLVAETAQRQLAKEGSPLFQEVEMSLQWPGAGGNNEQDVFALRDGRPLLVSCKTGRTAFHKTNLAELVDRSAQLGGEYCAKMYVTDRQKPQASSRDRTAFEEFAESARKRKICLVTGDDLAELGQRLDLVMTEPEFAAL